MGILEKIGMLKMDFLGLSNLSVLAKAVRAIEQNSGTKLDLLKIPEDDPKTAELHKRATNRAEILRSRQQAPIAPPGPMGSRVRNHPLLGRTR